MSEGEPSSSSQTRVSINRRALFAICILALVVIVIWVPFLIVNLVDPDFQPKPFEQQAWLENRQDVSGRYSDRMLMVDDLLRQHDFTGWTRGQVKELLGTPDYPSAGSGYDFAYDLGPERGMISVDYALLEFSLTDQGAVQGCTVRSH
ncbi:hypothetical protein JXA47_12205 [Candidatus Sumerlaeota bacterium]|nr:hypothetical protein [Candidatus Sumerlaeota bacterium]